MTIGLGRDGAYGVISPPSVILLAEIKPAIDLQGLAGHPIREVGDEEQGD